MTVSELKNDYRSKVKGIVYIKSDKHHEIKDYKKFGFDRQPYLSDDEAKDFRFILLQNRINELLKDYKNYDGVAFTDVSGTFIQVEIYNKEMALADDVYLKRDFSNQEEIIEEAVRLFTNHDNPKDIDYWNNFYNDGMKYGWD